MRWVASQQAPVLVSLTRGGVVAVEAQRQVPEPSPGQVVEVRGGNWAVTDVQVQGLWRSPADESRAGVQHVVSLQSIDEDRLGEELSVVWELEVGHTVVPDQGLPDTLSPAGFDDPNTLGAFVDAVRWGAVTSADENSFQAPFRSGATVEAYQLEPLRRALSAPRTNLLLADDVGLGKTIEAGLVIQELLLRHRARSVVIVCPPSLAIKWQEEMREKFGLEFVIVNSELLAETRRSHGLAANPFALFPRVIVSMAWLPSPRAQRLLRSILAAAEGSSSARQYAFDVLVVDEAHHVAPSSPSSLGGGRGYAVDSKRTAAVKRLARQCEHRLFLSATPHNGHSESFTALLEMIDDRRFSRGAKVDEQALRDVTVRRLKTEIADKDFQKREIKVLPFEPSEDEERSFATLDSILTESAKANGRRGSGGILSLLLKKRFLSSPWAFAQTMRLYEEAPDTATRLLGEYQEVLGSDASDEEEGAVEHPEFVAMVREKGYDPLSEATDEQVEGLISWGAGYQHRPDSRMRALFEMLDAVCRPDGTWTNERVVVFTEYADTVEWARTVLEAHGYPRDRLAVIQGSTPAEERELIRARFTAPPDQEPLRVLLATDAAGEGIDLQNYCHRLVNLDVPFNPSRLEQRIGRIDRYGQRYAPEVYYFKPTRASSTFGADQDFVQRLALKVATVREDLGSVNAVVDGEVQAHFLGRATHAAPSVDPNAAIQRALAGEHRLNRTLTELTRGYDAQKKRLHLTPFNARRVVETALALTNEPPLAVDLDREEGEPETFTVDHLGRGWQGALAGLDTRLQQGRLRPVTFDEEVAREHRDVVHIHLGHALMQKSSRLLRSTLFGSASPVHRVTAVVDESVPQSCVATVSRLVLVGRGGLRLHEEVFLSGIRLRGNDMAEERVNDLLDATLDHPGLRLADEAVRQELVRRWNDPESRMRRRLEEAMESRARRKQTDVESRLVERREHDIARAKEIFAAFRLNLRDSLEQARSEQEEQVYMLLQDDQSAQRRRDIDAMVARLETLDEEEAREVTAIERRYEDVRPFVSAAAVVFALTPADAAAMGGAR